MEKICGPRSEVQCTGVHYPVRQLTPFLARAVHVRQKTPRMNERGRGMSQF